MLETQNAWAHTNEQFLVTIGSQIKWGQVMEDRLYSRTDRKLAALSKGLTRAKHVSVDRLCHEGVIRWSPLSMTVVTYNINFFHSEYRKFLSNSSLPKGGLPFESSQHHLSNRPSLMVNLFQVPRIDIGICSQYAYHSRKSFLNFVSSLAYRSFVLTNHHKRRNWVYIGRLLLRASYFIFQVAES